jgi:hypothetical protein
MAEIYVMGHGNWDTSGAGQPFVAVPPGTSVVFYTPMGRFISSNQTVDIIRGAATKLAPDREVGERKQCPNVTLSDGLFPEEVKALMESGVRYARVTQKTSISELLEKYAGNRLHWLACMPRLGGKDTTQGGFNDDYVPGQGIGV